MDVFITPEAKREIEALRIVRPAASTWGFLIGHKRGFRFIIENVFPAGSARSLPNERLLAALDGVWPGGIIGLFAVHPDAAFKKAVLGPAWYGKLVLDLGLDPRKPSVRPFTVEFGRKFSLVRIRLAPAVKTRTHD
jgi:hypothetical protein